MTDLLDFYHPSGPYPLGSSGAPSMPDDGQDDLGFGDPLAKAYAKVNRLAKQTAVRYGPSNKPSGVIYDPRGAKALSSEFADFRKVRRGVKRIGYLSQKNFIQESTKTFEGNLPKPKNIRERTFNINPVVLRSPKSGLSKWGAHALGASLAQYRRSTVSTINIPTGTGTPIKVSNDLGFVTEDGGVPVPFLRKGPQATTQVIANLMTGRAPYQYVDANGVVHKYAPGTGPYDAPGPSRPGGVSGAVPGTVIGRLGATPADTGAIVSGEIQLIKPIEVLGTQDEPAKTHDFYVPDPENGSVDVSQTASQNGGGDVVPPAASSPPPPSDGWQLPVGESSTIPGEGVTYGAPVTDTRYAAGGFAATTENGNGNGVSWAHVFGFVGASVVAIMGLGMLVKGTK